MIVYNAINLALILSVRIITNWMTGRFSKEAIIVRIILALCYHSEYHYLGLSVSKTVKINLNETGIKDAESNLNQIFMFTSH